MAEREEVLGQGQGQGQHQVGIAMTTTTILEIAGERLDEDVVEDVVPEVLLRHEDEDEEEDEEEEEEVHQQLQEISLLLLTMVCPFFTFLFAIHHPTDFAPSPPPPARPPVQPSRPPISTAVSNPGHPNCDCDTPAVERTVQKEGANKGRKFWRCGGGPEKDCSFFAWADGNLPPTSRIVSGPNIERIIPAKRKVRGITRPSNGTLTHAIGISPTARRPSRWPIKTLSL